MANQWGDYHITLIRSPHLHPYLDIHKNQIEKVTVQLISLWWLHSLEELWSLYDFTLRLRKATPLGSHRGL